MPSTYTPIATQTLSIAAASVTFSSISGSYTDLVLIANSRDTNVSSATTMFVRVNNVSSGTLYSNTLLLGDGTVAASQRASNQNEIGVYVSTGSTAAADTFASNILHFQNYANTTTNKTILGRSNNAGSTVRASVAMFRSTNAITEINLLPATTFAAGSTFTLYGVKSA
jgi:hypothetical protein